MTVITKALKLSHMPNNGSAMLAVFCDLAAKDQIDFRPWLAEDMFPARLNIGFNNCASFNLIKGEGTEFVTLYETPSLGKLYDVQYQALRKMRTPRDTAFHKKFQNLERYILSWVGPEISRTKNSFSTYIRIDRFDPEYHLIEDFNTWFMNTYVQALAKSTEIVGLRRYISIEGPHKYFFIQEIIDLETSRDNEQSLQKTKFGLKISGIYEKTIQSSLNLTQ